MSDRPRIVVNPLHPRPGYDVWVAYSPERPQIGAHRGATKLQAFFKARTALKEHEAKRLEGLRLEQVEDTIAGVGEGWSADPVLTEMEQRADEEAHMSVARDVWVQGDQPMGSTWRVGPGLTQTHPPCATEKYAKGHPSTWEAEAKEQRKRAEAAEAERDEATEKAKDAEATLCAWFDRRKLAHEAIDEAVLSAVRGYLRTSRSGGMDRDTSDMIEGVIADMAHMSVFADLFARAALGRMIAEAVEAEREGCARTVESLWAFRTCSEVAVAIRARAALTDGEVE